ncbi:MAG TPA: molecular chaperone DnaJ [Clostridiales bacterium]|nr:molecular chaperone DnaJ [Clostridiales bacterium]
MADGKRDYYELLGVDRSATPEDIKKAYRKLAKKYHPAMNPGDKDAEEKFKEVNEANDVLSDPQKRENYDRFGSADGPQGFAGSGGFNGGFGGFDVGDIFESFFGGGSARRRNGPERGEDIAVRLMISFEEAVFGCKKEISFNRYETCSFCQGSGAEKGTKPETCSRCGGSGQIHMQQRSLLGTIQTTRPCDTCGGTGKIIKNPCSTCHGDGVERKTKKLEVSIPAGIDDGQRVLVKGQGNGGKRGGSSGDLYVQVGVRPHPVFEREGYNLFCEVPITFAEATLGAQITVPTLEGEYKFTITEGTQSGTAFTLKNKGVQMINSRSRGDLIFQVNLEVPKRLTNKQKELLKEFDKSLSNSNLDERATFLEKLKNVFKSEK